MVTGIIAEYNPFHNGHKLQIDYAKNTLKSDYIVVALSPDFTQRGEIAILSKYERAKIALSLGVDLVVQIPINSATDSSSGYSYGGIKMLDSLGIVDTLLFSVEDDDINLLTRIADIELNEVKLYSDTINDNMRSGMSYPSAREKAIMHLMPDVNFAILQSVLKQPNNILAIEYLKSLKLLKSDITPICMKRLFVSYHDTVISNRIASATAVRNAICDNDFDSIRTVVPDLAFTIYKEMQNNNMFLHPDDVSQMLGYKLIEGDLSKYKDCNDELCNKIENALSSYTGFTQFRGMLKSKDITETRLSRVLCHILLNITDDLYFEENGKIYPYTPYVYILGFNDRGAELMNSVKNKCKLPYFTSYNDALSYDFCSSSIDVDKCKAVLDIDMNATKVANVIFAGKTSFQVTPELSRKFLKI